MIEKSDFLSETSDFLSPCTPCGLGLVSPPSPEAQKVRLSQFQKSDFLSEKSNFLSQKSDFLIQKSDFLSKKSD